MFLVRSSGSKLYGHMVSGVGKRWTGGCLHWMWPRSICLEDLLVPFRLGEVFSKLGLGRRRELSTGELPIVVQMGVLEARVGCGGAVGLDKACYSFGDVRCRLVGQRCPD